MVGGGSVFVSREVSESSRVLTSFARVASRRAISPRQDSGVPIVCFKSDAEPPLAPPSQAVEERDGLKASLAATNDELAKSKSKANALDVSVVQHGASVDRLKVRDRSLSVPRENPRR